MGAVEDSVNGADVTECILGELRREIARLETRNATLIAQYRMLDNKVARWMMDARDLLTIPSKPEDVAGFLSRVSKGER